MINFLLKNTGDGASKVFEVNDIVLDKSMFSDIYLKLFATKEDYWGNDIFGTSFSSQTQKALTENSNDQVGLDNIKRAVESDLKNIDYATFTVDVSLLNSFVQITITADTDDYLNIVWKETDKLEIETNIL